MRLLLLSVAALVLAAPAIASEKHPTPGELEAEIVCPTCRTTLELSNAPIAEQMKSFIRERIAAGDTKSEIKDKLVALFGERVLAEPPKKGFDLLAWVLPLGGILVGGLALGLAAWHWSGARGAAPESDNRPLDPELERRLDDELTRFDA
jgi:cytochrome c-type biogenesis protein CcmH